MNLNDLLARLVHSGALALLLLGAVAAVDAVESIEGTRFRRKLALSAVFSAAILYELSSATVLPHGMRLDSRLTVIAGALLVGGPVVAVVTAVAGLLYRAMGGGFGAITAQVILVFMPTFSILALFFRRKLMPARAALALDAFLVAACAAAAPLASAGFMRLSGFPSSLSQSTLYGLSGLEGLSALGAGLVLVLYRKRQRHLRHLTEYGEEARALLNAVPDALLVVTADGQVSNARAGGLRKTNDGLQRLVSEYVSQGVDEAIAARFRGAVQRVLDGQGPQEGSFSVRRPDGDMFEGEFRAVLASEERVMLVIRDVSELKSTAASLQATRQQLELLAGSVPDFLGIIEPDGSLSYATPACTVSGKWTKEDLALHQWGRFLSPHDAQRARAAVDAIRSGAQTSLELELRSDEIMPAGPAARWSKVKYSEVTRDGKPTGQVLFHGRDITIARQLESRARLAELAVQHMSDGVLVTRAQDQSIVLANRGFAALSGYSEADTLNSQADRLLNSFPVSGAADKAEALRVAGTWSGELLSQRKDGSWFPEWRHISQFVSPVDDQTYYVALIRDLSQERSQQEVIYSLKHRDPVTGLPNRGYFMSQVKSSIAKEPAPESMLVVMLEMHNFAALTKSLGRATGDRLLKLVSVRLKEKLRDDAALARVEAGAFAWMAEPASDASQQTAQLVRLLQLFTTPFVLDGRDLYLRANIGVACFPADADSAEGLLHKSHIALEGCQHKVGNQVAYFQKDAGDAGLRRLSLEADLRKALLSEPEQLRLHYQPKVRLADDEVRGFEALVRWRHPELGDIAPSEFVALAEESGLIHFLGSWVFAEACAQLAKWRDEGLTIKPVAVNLSVLQMHDEKLPQRLLEAARKVGLEPQYLELEVTESEVMDDLAQTTRMLEELRSLGFRVALDDFGTGHSSMAYVQRLPLDVLKLDRSFVSGLGASRESEAIVKTLVSMANSLSLETVAEGVETELQRDYLRDLGCHTIQGHLFSAAVPAAEAGRWLEAATALRSAVIPGKSPLTLKP